MFTLKHVFRTGILNQSHWLTIAALGHKLSPVNRNADIFQVTYEEAAELPVQTPPIKCFFSSKLSSSNPCEQANFK